MVELRDQGDVDAVVEEGGGRVVVGQRFDAQLGARELLAHRAHDVGHPLVVRGALRRQTERAAAAVGELAQVEASGAQLAQRDLRGLQHPPTGGGGDQPATAPLEQRGAEALLQPEEALAQGRLTDEEVAGRGGQRGVLAERVEQLQVADVNSHNVT